MYKAIDKWFLPYLFRQHRPKVTGMTDVLFCVCDHFEPFHEASHEEAAIRVSRWSLQFPYLTAGFTDADGYSPAHTFFYPISHPNEEMISGVAALCRNLHAEMEIHLHHDNDTPANLITTVESAKALMTEHQMLSRDEQNRVRFGFIHGDWALDNSHPEGRFCGVSTELGILKTLGCYADFTMPSAPDHTQTRIINSIYYAVDTPAPKSHDRGYPLHVGVPGAANPLRDDPESLLLVQGPLGFNWGQRKYNLLPRLENGEISEVNPPSPDRMRLWIQFGIHVTGRPEWVVIKLHTHGAIPRNMRCLLGESMVNFYQYLQTTFTESKQFRLHYVTARELVNILHAAEAGETGNPGLYRDYRYRLICAKPKP